MKKLFVTISLVFALLIFAACPDNSEENLTLIATQNENNPGAELSVITPEPEESAEEIPEIDEEPEEVPEEIPVAEEVPVVVEPPAAEEVPMVIEVIEEPEPAEPEEPVVYIPSIPHPFAQALSEFFVNLAEPPEWADMQTQTHAVLVDLDGNGTQGVVVSKWSDDRERYHPTATNSIFVQKMFYFYNGQLHSFEHFNYVVTQAGRFIVMERADAQGVSLSAYTLLDFVGGRLAPAKTISTVEYWRLEDYGIQPESEDDRYYVYYHFDGSWDREWEVQVPITQDEFNELLTMYSLHNITDFIWTLPDDTQTIMQMTIN